LLPDDLMNHMVDKVGTIGQSTQKTIV